ncbi:MAG: Asp-tRNA(Asn)/Glu-tRNA(Gln) amidotransferase subunit GatA [Candidatus Woesearchaeota archaeon]|jgi:aspartyl-tRNA(Asn)/glutamyl-tRNA(Gln) amidotransferase subunit A|nr:Asp-tRNA(Asn)/Glu-tRNA(Gln) amidotransferase subunit GatA [Candidatus Woesearchaeota archaeon]
MSNLEFIKKVQNKEIDVVEHTHKVIEETKKINKEYNYLNTISEDQALEQAEQLKKSPKGKLAGLPISIKDCICVKDVESRAGSKILEGYKPLFNATAVEKLKAEGAIIIGKTSQDEFGFGGFSTNVGIDFKVPLNPFDKERSCGGSSGGSAGITQKATFPHISLGESTGGSIVNPASFCGVVGMCPTYGRVSRYGLLDYANSLDKIGPMTRTIEDAALALQIISGHDPKESTSLNTKVESFISYLNKENKNIKIGVIKESLAEGVNSSVKNKVWDSIKQLENQNISYEEVSLPITMKHSLAAYYLIATAEASTNLAKYCGMRYGKHEQLEGNFNEYFTKVRSKNLGQEAKRRIILGTFARMAGFRDAYYIKATKIRTLIIEEYKKLFKKYDALISPTVPILPPKFKDIEQLSLLENYMIDVLTVGPNLAGLPHINIPVGHENNLPIGMMLTADHLNEGKLLQIGSAL